MRKIVLTMMGLLVLLLAIASMLSASNQAQAEDNVVYATDAPGSILLEWELHSNSNTWHDEVWPAGGLLIVFPRNGEIVYKKASQERYVAEAIATLTTALGPRVCRASAELQSLVASQLRIPKNGIVPLLERQRDAHLNMVMAIAVGLCPS